MKKVLACLTITALAVFCIFSLVNAESAKTNDGSGVVQKIPNYTPSSIEGKKQSVNSADGYALGQSVPNFSLSAIDGKKVSLDSYKGKSVVVLDFWSAQCPVSKAYEDYMKKLTSDYASKGVVFLALAANKTESKDWITNVAKERNVNFPILMDENHILADKFDAQHTPELFVLDKNGVVQYHGAPDNQKQSSDPSYKDHARQALNELLANKVVSVKETKAFGCSIKR